MGLTLHYSLHSDLGSGSRDVQEARRLIGSLHRRALDLPFQRVGEILDLAGDACDYRQRDEDDPRRWLLIQASNAIEREGVRLEVSPIRLIAFTAIPGEGCEPANFGLCCYPATVQDAQGHKRRTKITGWSWQAFCKTQYASNPELGGVENFLRCHVSLIRLLDHARELGILNEVSDESGYWQNRDAKALAQTVGQWNTMIAGFVGRMKDQLGDGSSEGGVGGAVGGIQSEITKFPNFEHLEAEGRAGEDEEELESSGN